MDRPTTRASKHFVQLVVAQKWLTDELFSRCDGKGSGNCMSDDENLRATESRDHVLTFLNGAVPEADGIPQNLLHRSLPGLEV